METTEAQWGPWIEWNGGECPIPDARYGSWQGKFRDGFTFTGTGDPDGYMWEHKAAFPSIEIIAYRRKAATDDWKADMLAAWEAGDLEYSFNSGVWVKADRERGEPSFCMARQYYRRRPAAEQPQEPADPNAAMIARDGAPKGDKPADEVKDEAPPGNPAPTGLTACAPFTHKFGGWGL